VDGAFPPTQNPQECVCVISPDIFSNPLSCELAEQSILSGTGTLAARNSGLLRIPWLAMKNCYIM